MDREGPAVFGAETVFDVVFGAVVLDVFGDVVTGLFGTAFLPEEFGDLDLADFFQSIRCAGSP